MELADDFFVLSIFIVLSAFFSGIETAFTSISKIRIQHLLEQEVRGIDLVKKLKENNERLIITILIGNNVVNIAASSIATSISIEVFSSNAVGIAVGIMTLVVLIFGEILPKSIAMTKNEPIAIRTAPIIRSLQYIFLPIIKIFELFTFLVSKTIGGTSSDPVITEEEIKSVVSLGEEVGEVEKNERIMIHNIFRFGDLQASQIMIDRTHMFTIDAEKKIKDMAPEIVRRGFSRIPIFEEKPDKIIGILYAKDVLQAFLTETFNDDPVRVLARPAKFVPETILIDDLLKEFQKAKVHIALVVDEHGGISGLITIEDLLEEIVGDIYDETDREQIMIKKLSENKIIVKGETEIEKVDEILQLNLGEQGDYETISGFILSQLRRIPEVDEEFRLDSLIINVIKADRQRIIEVGIEKVEVNINENDTENHAENNTTKS